MRRLAVLGCVASMVDGDVATIGAQAASVRQLPAANP